MIAIPLLAVLLVASPRDSKPVGAPQASGAVVTDQRLISERPNLTPERLEQIKRKMEQARIAHESARKAALHINDLAGNIHSEADARTFVDAVAKALTGHQHLFWTGLSIRHRVAHAEYETVSDPSRLIPEQRVVDVWNEYVREIDAPEEALVTVAELHNLRDSMYALAHYISWKQDLGQSIWTMPNIYALDSDGRVASGCRAIEALKIIHDMHEMFMNVRAARDRVAIGMLTSDRLKEREQNPVPSPAPVLRSQLVAKTHFGVYQDPIRSAAFRYQREHGESAYQQLLRRLFAELFPEG